jgi:hypothetical protein
MADNKDQSQQGIEPEPVPPEPVPPEPDPGPDIADTKPEDDTPVAKPELIPHPWQD